MAKAIGYPSTLGDAPAAAATNVQPPGSLSSPSSSSPLPSSSTPASSSIVSGAVSNLSPAAVSNLSPAACERIADLKALVNTPVSASGQAGRIADLKAALAALEQALGGDAPA